MRADVFDPAKRSAVMRAVKSRDTAPELTVRAAVRELGYARRYRLNGASLPGKPDLVFGAMRKAVFVHGCFWHRHVKCRRSTTPVARKEFWLSKFARNVSRDRRNARGLRRMGWSVWVIWECQASRAAIVERRLRPILRRTIEGGRIKGESRF